MILYVHCTNGLYHYVHVLQQQIGRETSGTLLECHKHRPTEAIRGDEVRIVTRRRIQLTLPDNSFSNCSMALVTVNESKNECRLATGHTVMSLILILCAR